MVDRVSLARKGISALLSVSLLVSGGLTAVVFVAPSLVTLGLFLFILPGVILALAPTVFLYLSVFSVVWFALSRKPAPVAAGMGVAAMVVVALLIPELMNQATGHELERESSRAVDRSGALDAQPWRTVALQPQAFSTQATCNDLCRLLLFNGEVERVVVLPPADPPPARKRQRSKPYPPTAFRIERGVACPADKHLYRSNHADSWLAKDDTKEIDKAVRLRAATGECLVMEPATDAAADLTIRLIQQTDPFATRQLRLGPATVSARGVELMAGGQVVLRKVALRTAFYKRPLHLEPIENGLAMSGWRWGRRNFSAGDEVEVGRTLREAAGFHLSPIPGVSPKRLRRELNQALGRPELPGDDAAFLLAEDFLRDLGEDISPEEAALVGRIIRDQRFTAFGALRGEMMKDPHAAAAAQDAMLDRLTALAREKNRSHYRQLEDRIGDLPEGAFHQPDPRVDALLADNTVRAGSPHLVVRLAERGPSAAPVLLGYIRGRWSSNETRFYRFDRDAQAALAGLCLLGDGARDSLPALRQMERSGLVPDYVPATPHWRATLIALGASPGEFTPPGREQPDTYRRRLIDLSRRCPLP